MIDPNSNDPPEHLQGYENLKVKANYWLSEALVASNINSPAEQLYINSINNHEERLVVFSASLVQIVAEAVQHEQPPVITAAYSGLFNTPYSFDDEHRLDHRLISIEAIAAIASQVYQQLTT